MGKIDKSAVSGQILCTIHRCKSAAFCGVAIRAVLKWQVLAGFLGARSINCRCPPLSPAGAARRDRIAAGLIAAFSWQKQKQTRGLVATSTRVVFPLQQAAATLASSYIEQREAFAFLVPKTMIRRRRRWRQQEREKAVRNVFEAQMHARMRRQSLKHVELRRPEALEADCVTLDLGSARSSDTSLRQERAATRVVSCGDKAGQCKWVPHSIEELEASSSSSSSSDDIGDIFSPGREEEGDELVLKVRQPLSQGAWFRLEKLGGLDTALAVPAFVYRVFLGEEKDFSGDATEGSRGVFRLPRLLHNSRVNLPPRSVDCYL